MKRLFVPIFLISPLLHSQELGGIDISLSQFTCAGSISNLHSNSSSRFSGQSIGVGVRIPDQDRIGNVWRFSIEKSFHTYDPNTSVSEVKNNYSLSWDYLWQFPKKFHMGAGIRVIKYDTIPYPSSPSPHPIMSSQEFGKNIEYYPQFISSFQLMNHVSMELDLSLVRYDLQFRYSF